MRTLLFIALASLLIFFGLDALGLIIGILAGLLAGVVGILTALFGAIIGIALGLVGLLLPAIFILLIIAGIIHLLRTA